MSRPSFFKLAVLLAHLVALLQAFQATGAETYRQPYVRQSAYVDVLPHTREAVISHLLQDHNGEGRLYRENFASMTDDELFDLHSDLHAGKVRWDDVPVTSSGMTPRNIRIARDDVSPIKKITTSPPAETSKLRLATLLIRDRSRSSWGGSAVCVSSTGVVFTAKHITLGDNVIVAFPSLGERPAIRIHEQREAEGVRAFKITTPGEYPFVPVATAKSQQGDRVTYAGYPGGKGLDVYLEGTGTITGGQAGAVAGGGYNIVRNLGGPGMSGGPMVNARGDLVGLCHGGDQSAQYSQWIGSTAVIQAWSTITQPQQLQASAAPQSQPRLIAFSMTGCAGCNQFEADFTRGRIPELYAMRDRVLIVKQTNGVWSHPDIVASYERTTGRRLDSVPLFWVEGTKTYSAEPYSLGGFCAWIKGIIRAILGIPPKVVVVNPPPVVATPPMVPAIVGGDPSLSVGVGVGGVGVGVDIGVPLPREVPAIDPADIMVAVLAAEQDVGLIRGQSRRVALLQAKRILRERVNTRLGDRADIELVSQRIDPQWYATVKPLTGLEPNPLAVVVLVKQFGNGLVKSIIERKVLGIVQDKIPAGWPVFIKVVFAGNDPMTYAAIRDALLIGGDDAGPPPAPPVEVVPPVVGGLTPANIDLGAEAGVGTAVISEGLEPQVIVPVVPSAEVAVLPELPAAGTTSLAAEENWHAVEIFVVVRRVLTGAKGVAAGLALRKAVGPVRRKIDSIFEGKPFKPELDLISERLEPERFAAFVAAADIDPQPVAIVVRVGKAFSGVKGLVAGKVVAILTGHVPKGVPVDLVLERVNPDDYRRIGDAAHGVVPVVPVPVVPVEPPSVDVIPSTTELGPPLFEAESVETSATPTLLDDVRQAAAVGAADGSAGTFVTLDKILKQREADLTANLEARMKAIAREAIQQAKAEDSGVESKVQTGTGVTILGIVGELLRRRWIRDRQEKKLLAMVGDVPPASAA